MLQNRLVRTKAMFIVSILCTFPFYYGCHFVFDKKKKNLFLEMVWGEIKNKLTKSDVCGGRLLCGF